jgi:hypothetical protein
MLIQFKPMPELATGAAWTRQAQAESPPRPECATRRAATVRFEAGVLAAFIYDQHAVAAWGAEASVLLQYLAWVIGRRSF